MQHEHESLQAAERNLQKGFQELENEVDMELGLRQQRSPQSQIDPCSAPDVHATSTPDTILQQGTVEDTRNSVLGRWSMQAESFPEEYSAFVGEKELPKESKLLRLRPRLDEDGLMRCDGRLRYADYLPYDVRYPVILPRRNWVTKLIVKHYHEQGKHVAGTNHTLSALSTRFWIIAGREEIRQWEKECANCRRQKAKSASQVMAPLPNIRLKMPLRAFADVAVDYAGPFITIQGGDKQRRKLYLCLFTCLATRAVHLEVAYGLDTDSFLNAFYRMVNRRGLPKQVLSDDGSNFVAQLTRNSEHWSNNWTRIKSRGPLQIKE
ncbi:uncharacterized protein [Ptychodera flava]|uniref:uncharacterized protein n=1 Tax=Ptychodera flava TaxID=63121 RepID=UPI00396A863B